MENPRPPQAVAEADYPEILHLDRANVILRIRLALQTRSGKTWSVSGGRGTDWGWLRITAPPARRLPMDCITDEDRDELTELLGLDDQAPVQGVSVPDSYDYYREFIDRAEGRKPRVLGKPYWD